MIWLVMSKAFAALQLVKAVRRAKQSWMQSQDCVRIMASSAAAAEARACQLQDTLSEVNNHLDFELYAS